MPENADPFKLQQMQSRNLKSFALMRLLHFLTSTRSTGPGTLAADQTLLDTVLGFHWCIYW